MAARNLPAKQGRPSLYTSDLAEEILDKLSEGQTLTSICKAPHIPTDACVRKWAIEDVDGFSSRYTRARDTGLDRRADELLDLVETVDPEPGKVQKARLIADTWKWYLSKLAHKRYGDRLHVVGDADADPVKSDIDDTALARRIAFQLSLGEKAGESST